MKNRGQLKIGEIGAPHGLKGQAFAFFYHKEWIVHFQNKEILKKVSLIGSKIGSKIGSQKSFFSLIEAVSPFKKGALVKLRDIRTRLEAEAFRGFHICIPASLLESKSGEPIYLHEILHFNVKTKEGSLIGVITGFSSNGPQDLLRVQTSSGQKEIPFVEEFIYSLSFQDQSVKMDLPEGLLSL